jgi:hypothetical protein
MIFTMERHVLSYKNIFLKALAGKSAITGGLAFSQNLNPLRFDFTLESLYYVDCYLFSIYVAKDELDENQVENSIWAMGFYLGEVIARNSSRGYQWKNWENFFPNQSVKVQEAYFETMGTSAILVRGKRSFILPIDQVIRFIRKGPENSLHHFAQIEIENLKGRNLKADSLLYD